jgi:hypothetical protein
VERDEVLVLADWTVTLSSPPLRCRGACGCEHDLPRSMDVNGVSACEHGFFRKAWVWMMSKEQEGGKKRVEMTELNVLIYQTAGPVIVSPSGFSGSKHGRGSARLRIWTHRHGFDGCLVGSMHQK